MKRPKQTQMGWTALFALLLAVSVSLTSTMFYYSGYVNSFLGLTGETVAVEGDTNYYPSMLGELNAENSDRLIELEKEHSIQAMHEGTVLIRNENNTLPLTSAERRITVFGNNATDPVYRTNAGNASFSDECGGTLYEAPESAGFSINPVLREAYANSGVRRVSDRLLHFRLHGNQRWHHRSFGSHRCRYQPDHRFLSASVRGSCHLRCHVR